MWIVGSSDPYPTAEVYQNCPPVNMRPPCPMVRHRVALTHFHPLTPSPRQSSISPPYAHASWPYVSVVSSHRIYIYVCVCVCICSYPYPQFYSPLSSRLCYIRNSRFACFNPHLHCFSSTTLCIYFPMSTMYPLSPHPSVSVFSNILWVLQVSI